MTQTIGYLPEAANSVGGWLTGVLPYREAGASPTRHKGLDARAMLESPRKAYLLLGVEPELDGWDTVAAQTAVEQADFVVSIHPFVNPSITSYANVLLPAATAGETSGTYINAEGRWQSFGGAGKPLGESRPAWKILRVLGNALNLDGFEYLDSQQVLAEVQKRCEGIEPHNLVAVEGPFTPLQMSGPLRVADVPIYAADALVRRAPSLQKTPQVRPAEITLHPELAGALGLVDATQARLRYGGNEAALPLVLDEGVAKDCIWVPSGLTDTAFLGPAVGSIEIDSV